MRVISILLAGALASCTHAASCQDEFVACRDSCHNQPRQCLLRCARTSAYCKLPEVTPLPSKPQAQAQQWPSFHDALGKPTIPFGFYQYTVTAPNDLDSPGLEARYGMSLVSPYSSSSAPTDQWWKDTAAFLDRAAAAGFKVNFQLIAFEALSNNASVLANLTAQIERFKGHPAILAWYLADEPDGQGLPVASLLPKYKAIKAADPSHPVAMVFCTAGAAAYDSVVDLIMVDPYPVPNSPAGSMLDAVLNVAGLGKPLMLVPQAFGGGENWARAPSAQEERAMTYLGLMHGVCAVQYFVRELGVFPMPNAWSEIRKLASELKELTPSLLGGSPVAVHVLPTDASADCAVQAAGFRDRDGSVVVIAVNAANSNGAPCGFRVGVNTSWGSGANYSVGGMFENRNLATGITATGQFRDALRGFGTAVYRVEDGSSRASSSANLVYNGGYELCVNPAMPDGNYASGTPDSAAYYMGEFRDSVHGRTSLHFHAPSAGTSQSLSPYTLPKLTPDGEYTFSVWVKGTGTESVAFSFTPTILSSAAGSVIRVNATSTWQHVSVSMTAGHDLSTACKYGCRGWLGYAMETAGDVWIDELSLVATA